MVQQNPVEQNIVTDNITSINKTNDMRSGMNLDPVAPAVDSDVEMQMAQVVPPKIEEKKEEVTPVREEGDDVIDKVLSEEFTEPVVEREEVDTEQIDLEGVDPAFERTGIRTGETTDILRPTETEEEKEIRLQNEEIRKREAAEKKRIDSPLARKYRDNIKVKPLRGENNQTIAYRVYLKDNNNDMLDAITYSLDEYSIEEINNMVDKAKKRIDKLDLIDLQSAPGQNPTFTRLATEALLRPAVSSPGPAIATAAVLAAPTAPVLAVVGGALVLNLDPFGWFDGAFDLPAAEGVISGIEKGEIKFRSLLGTDFYKDLVNGPVEELVGDGKGDLDPMKLEVITAYLDRESSLPFHITAMNLALAEMPIVGGYVGGLFLNRAFIGELAKESQTIARAVKRNNLEKAVNKKGKRLYSDKQIDKIMGGTPDKYNAKLEKHMPEYEADANTVGRRLGEWVKKTNKEKYGDKKFIFKLPAFKRTQVYEFSNRTGDSVKNLLGGEAIYYTAALGLDTFANESYGIGTFSNTAIAVSADILSGNVAKVGMMTTRGAVGILEQIVDPITKAFTRRTDIQTMRAASETLSDGSMEGFEALVKERAMQMARQEGVPANKFTEIHISNARAEIMKDFRGGEQMFGSLGKWLNGKYTLDDLNLTEAQKVAALKFKENFEQLSETSKERLIAQMDRAQVVYSSLKKMGIENPDKGFGLIFGLNTLRAIEPDLLQQGLQVSSDFGKKARGKFFNQIGLEEFYQKKNEYAIGLENYLKEVLAGRNQALQSQSGRLDFLQKDVQEHIKEVQEMINVTKIEQEGRVQMMGELIDFTIKEAKGLVHNSPMHQAKVSEYLRIIKSTNPELAADIQTKIEKRYRSSIKNLSNKIDQATDIESRRAATGKAVGTNLQNRLAKLQEDKDAAYKVAEEQLEKFEPVDGTDLFLNMKTTLDDVPVSEEARLAGITTIINPIEEIWGDIADKFLVSAQRELGLDSRKSFEKVIKSELAAVGVKGEEATKLISNPVNLMEYMIKNELPMGALGVPKFNLSATDLKNVELGLKHYVRKKQGNDTIQNYQAIKAGTIKNLVDEAVENAGLNTDAYAKADEIATRFWEFKSTNIYEKTLGTRQRYFSNEQAWEYKNSIETWGDVIFNDPSKADQVYREVKRMFQGDPEGLKQIVTDINKQALTILTEDVSKIDADDLGLFKEIVTGIGKRRLVRRDPNVEGGGLAVGKLKNVTKEKLAIIRKMEEASIGDDGIRLFNFDEAYNWNAKYRNWLKTDGDSIAQMEKLDNLRTEGNAAFKAMYKEEWNQMKKLLDDELQTFKDFRDNPQRLLDSIQSGNIANFKSQYVALQKSKGITSQAAEKKFNKAIHGLFVEGFISKYVTPSGQLKIKGDDIVGGRVGEFETVGALSGMDTLDFLNKNENMIRQYIPEVNLKAFREIAEAVSLGEAGKFVSKEGVVDITKGLPALTVGSYVSRLYAVSSGRTSLKYVGAEAMVVQMKRQEVAVIATLMMNPKSAERVAELIKSGKPLSTQLISSEASWLPKFIGEVDAMHEMMFGDEEGSDVMQVPQGQARIESILPQQTAMLNTMQQTLGG